MGKKERQAYLKAIHGRYAKAGCAEKSKILDEFCAVCGYARKYALRLLGRTPTKSSSAEPGRPSRYACGAVLTPVARDLASDRPDGLQTPSECLAAVAAALRGGARLARSLGARTAPVDFSSDHRPTARAGAA